MVNGGIAQFLISTLDGGELSASRPCCFNPSETAGTDSMGDSMGPRTGLDGVDKRGTSSLGQESNLDYLVVQRVSWSLYRLTYNKNAHSNRNLSAENPHFLQEIPLHTIKVGVTCALSGDGANVPVSYTEEIIVIDMLGGACSCNQATDRHQNSTDISNRILKLCIRPNSHANLDESACHDL
jgi:hypothetical protein